MALPQANISVHVIEGANTDQLSRAGARGWGSLGALLLLGLCIVLGQEGGWTVGGAGLRLVVTVILSWGWHLGASIWERRTSPSGGNWNGHQGREDLATGGGTG